MLKAAIIDNTTSGKERIRCIEAMVRDYGGGGRVELSTLRYDALPKDMGDFSCFILSGALSHVTEGDAPKFAEEMGLIKTAEVPIFGICFGHQLVMHTLAGEGAVEISAPNPSERDGSGGPGPTIVLDVAKDEGGILWPGKIRVNVNHRDYASPDNPAILRLFDIRATSVDANNGIAYIQYAKHKQRPIFTVQFHPEAYEGADPTLVETGRRIFHNFLKYVGTFPAL
jgi:GMP synthase-like glutamine amidotransferase